MAKDHIRDYTVAAANNTDVDGVNIGEGTAPSNINDAIREVMAHQAELHGDTRGGLTSGGSGGAYTLTTNEVITGYAQSGGLFVFEANHAMPSTATASLNVDGVGAKPLRKDVSVALSQNDILANQMCIVAYEGTTDVFHLLSRGDSGLADLTGLAATDGNFIVGNGTTWVAESTATARTSLGLGTIATQASDNVSITGGSVTGITDLAVADGGTASSTAAGDLGFGHFSDQVVVF